MTSEEIQQILEYFQTKESLVTAQEVAQALTLDLGETQKILKTLRKDGLISSTTKDTYQRKNYKIGRLQVLKNGAGFVVIDSENDIYIKKEYLKKAIEGDLVVVAFTTNKQDPSTIHPYISKVLSHSKDKQVGEVIKIGDQHYIKPQFRKDNILIKIDIINTNAVEGSLVTFILEDCIQNNIYDGKIVKIIGHKNDPQNDIISVAAAYDIEMEFSEETLQEIDRIPTVVTPEEMIGRTDLRDNMIITIDGDDTKDIDDAISLEILENGNYQLSVHIADVSYYIKEGSAIDKDAYSRGTSNYLADSVIPMLHHKLSNGICSLNPGEDRLSITCQMEYTPQGKLIDYDIFESVIRSKKKMTYKKVNEALADNPSPDYEPFINMLQNMRNLSNVLKKRKEKMGCIDFDVPEYKAIIDDRGKAVDIIPCDRGEGERIIETFMIAANETIATDEFYRGFPSVYRVHGEPNKERLFEFLQFLRINGEKIERLPNEIQPTIVKKLLESLKNSPNYELYASMLLKTMAKATYDINNIGHFGLASKCYTHFTSPIRRYPDLMVHRLIKAHRDSTIYDIENENKIEESRAYLEKATKWASLRERNAEKCERHVLKMKMAEYMEGHIGEQYFGIISSLAQRGMYIQIYNGVEGLLRYASLNHALYKPEKFCVETTEQIYHIGDPITVKVSHASKQEMHIDLELVPEEEALVLVKTLRPDCDYL